MKRVLLLFSLLTCLSLYAVSQVITGTYAIQNLKTGKNLRPYDAGKHNGNKIVLYDHVEWKCMTWDFIHLSENSYQLKNLFTLKTFQPAGKVESGCTLEQQVLVSGSQVQEWEFIETGKGNFNIRLKGTELYISLSDGLGKTNSDIVLKPKQNSDVQIWKLVKQNPSF